MSVNTNTDQRHKVASFMENEDSVSHRTFEPSVIAKYYGGENMPGAYSMFISLSRKTMEQLEGRLDSLCKAIEQSDFEEALHFAHQLKGSFLMAGSPRLGALCERIEILCQRRETVDLERHAEELVALSSVFRSELTLFLSGITNTHNG